MNKSITQKLKYKQSVIKFLYKYGVKKATIKFNEWPKTIYRWRQRYDGTLKSLEDCSRRPHSHPNQHTEEIKMIKRLIRYYPFKVKTIQTDNGFEFTNRLSWQAFMKNKKTLFEETLEELGIGYKVIKPHTSKQNGIL